MCRFRRNGPALLNTIYPSGVKFKFGSGNLKENNMKASKMIRHLLASAALSVITGLTSFAGAATVVVSPGNMDGWAFATTDSNGDAATFPGTITQMVTGPAAPPAGIGSAELGTAPGHGDGAAQISTTNFDGTPLGSINSLSYSTYDTVNNGQQFPYMQVFVSTTGSGPADDWLTFEPPYQQPATGNPGLPDQGAPAPLQWQQWNALEGGWYDADGFLGTNPGGSGDVDSLGSFLTQFPSATIEDSPFPGGLGGIELLVGYGGPTDNFDGNVDAVTIGTAGGTSTYDFEPASVPEPASLSLLGIGAGGLMLRRRRA
jgi:hypothetical protein